MCRVIRGFPGGSEVKASASNSGDPGSIPGSGRSPGEGNGNPLQYSCLENPMDGETDSVCKVEYMFSTCSIKLNSELIGKTFIIFFFPFLFQQEIIIEPWILIPRENKE